MGAGAFGILIIFFIFRLALHKFNNFDSISLVKILIIDNYDSFTYNLAHYVEAIIGARVDVFRNDVLDFNQLSSYDKIIISPGPGLPSEAGDLMPALKFIPENTPVLAVCLGMQAYAEKSGLALYNLAQTRHGIQVICELDVSSMLYQGLPSQIEVGLYHSWAVESNNLEEWNVTGKSEDGVIMSMDHRIKPIYCVQFHPESVLTPQGKKIIANFLISE
jgi:anthranilate synthase component 2